MGLDVACSIAFFASTPFLFLQFAAAAFLPLCSNVLLGLRYAADYGFVVTVFSEKSMALMVTELVAEDCARSAALARDNSGGLQSVCQALLEKSLFITNQSGLDELDDDGSVGDENRESRTREEDRENEEEGHGRGHEAAVGGEGSGVSELEVIQSRKE